MDVGGFDERNIKWNKLEGFDHIWYQVCNVDEKNGIVDILFKFSANKQIVLHRHKAPYSTLILKGELRIYEADGALKEIRPIGSYVSKPASDEPHREGGGDQDVIAFFSNRGVTGPVYEVLDDDLNPIATLGLQDFGGLLEAQQS
jgi:quercetin dioxygenase-like cupin family protein